MNTLTEAPWTGYQADWCAWFVSWVTRGLGRGKQTWADAWDDLPLIPQHQMRIGDFARINGEPPYHIGIISQLGPVRIIDGNRMRNGATWWGNSWVQEEPKYGDMIIRRPNYSGAAADPFLQPKEIHMIVAGLISTQQKFNFFPDGRIRVHHAGDDRAIELAVAWARQPDVYWYDDNDFAQLLWSHGLHQVLNVATVKTWVNYNYLPPWLA